MQLSWKQTMPVWWSFFWRALVYGILRGAALGFLAGLYATFLGVPDKGGLYGGTAGRFATIPASMLALKQSTSKHFSALSSATANAS